MRRPEDMKQRPMMDAHMRRQQTGMMGDDVRGMVQEVAGEMEAMDGEDFIESMIPHHEEAIRLAKAFLAGPSADDPALRRLAESIIQTQQAELETMRRAV